MKFVLAEVGQFGSSPVDGDPLVLQSMSWAGVIPVFPPEAFGVRVHVDVLTCPPVQFVFLLEFVLVSFDPLEVHGDWE